MESAAEKSTAPDWHPADIKAALAKKGYTFARIAREFKYFRNAPNMVLRKSWPIMEKIVGRVIGVKPALIWPSRYDRRGRPLKGSAVRAANKSGRLADVQTVSNA